MGKTTIQSHCGAKNLWKLVGDFDAFGNKAKPLGLEASWIKTKVHDFGCLQELVQLGHAYSEDNEVTESLHLLVVQFMTGILDQQVSRLIGLVAGDMTSVNI